MKHSNIIKALEVASDYGISSIRQLSVFLLFVDYEGCDLSEATGLTPDSSEFKTHMTTLSKLMVGSKYRGYDGLLLLEYAEQTVGKQRAVLLTGKGRELAQRLTGQFEIHKL